MSVRAGTGKIYRADNEFIVDVKYQFYDDSEYGWWGELVPTEYRRIIEGGGFVIELEDGRKGTCSLRKRVNRAVSGTPPLYHYHFRGSGRLK